MDVFGGVAVVTGGASGIGAACARSLTSLGARCVVVDTDEVQGRKVAHEIDATFVAASVTDASGVDRAVQTALRLGPVRVLVNAAGIGVTSARRTLSRDGAPYDLVAFDQVIQVNLVGTFNCVRLVAAAMAKSPATADEPCRGVIVNIASVAAYEGQVGQAAYAASKGGVVSMTLPLARDLAPVGIRVNAVAPGMVDTAIFGSGLHADAMRARLREQVLFPDRLGLPSEVGSLVCEVVRNDYINAEVLRIDAGLRMAAR
jgi:NAD(P)-dependent dehydrogenase (short-subunit alcohol dehydrogenase family)